MASKFAKMIYLLDSFKFHIVGLSIVIGYCSYEKWMKQQAIESVISIDRDIRKSKKKSSDYGYYIGDGIWLSSMEGAIAELGQMKKNDSNDLNDSNDSNEKII